MLEVAALPVLSDLRLHPCALRLCHQVVVVQTYAFQQLVLQETHDAWYTPLDTMLTLILSLVS